MLKLLKYLNSRDWSFIFVSLIFIVIQVWLDLKMPEYMSEITRLVQTPGSKMGDIWLNGSLMLLCTLGSVAAAIVVGFFAARIGASFSHRLRGKMFGKVDSFSMEEINKYSTASLITRSTNDITQVQMLITMGMQVMIKAPILAVWAILKITNKGVEWSAATGIAVAILLVMVAVIFILAVPKFKKMQTLTDNLNKVTRENLTGLPVVRAYNAEKFQETKFEKANSELTQTQLFTSRIMAFMMPVMSLIMSGLNLAIYLIGMWLIKSTDPSSTVIIDGETVSTRLMTFSDMVVFSAYAVQVIMAFIMIIMMFIFVPRASVSAKRINEVLNTNPNIKDGTQTQGQDGKTGEITFNGVGFKYPGAADYVIKDITFTAKRGETVAFIGSTGSGKSSLINLIPRFFDATEGEVLLNGINVKEYSLSALHNKIGYVPQKAVLFSGTVSSNVAFGNNGTNNPEQHSDIEQAIKIAQASGFVSRMEKGYNSDIARGGANLSGGQKQRLSIARAICRKPEFYIFDDSFSALDYKTDRQLRTALKAQTEGTTSLIVAQRIGTIRDADKIIVLDEGKIAGIGKHKELLKSCKVYKEIASSQLSEEELAK